MAAKLARLLGVSEPVVAVTIRQLEDASGHPSVDVRLLSEIIQKSHQKTAELGLDPRDTTSHELYILLQDKLRADNERLLEELGCTRTSTANDVLKCVVDAVSALNIPKSCWTIKASVLKKMLKTLPPKKYHEVFRV